MKMVENQSSHRIETEKYAIKEELRQSSLGQILGFIIALVFGGFAFLSAFTGHDAIAGICFSTTIIGLVTVFVIGKRHQNKESE